MKEILIVGPGESAFSESDALSHALRLAEVAGYTVRIVAANDPAAAHAIKSLGIPALVPPPDPQVVLEQVVIKAESPVYDEPSLKRRGKHRGQTAGAFGGRR